MNIEDYRFMLESAKEHLDELPKLYRECLRAEEVPKRLTNKIRYILNDIESALDYIAFYIFNRYCLTHIDDPKKIESKRRQVNFPLYDPKERFDREIDKRFLGLRSEKPELIEIFESQQSFVKGKDYWLPIFNKLANNNKHRELEKQEISSTSRINYMEDVFGNQFINGNVSEIIYENTEINFRNYKPNPYIKNISATVKVDFIFKGLNLSVLPTLTKIYDGAHSVIDELEKAMERN